MRMVGGAGSPQGEPAVAVLVAVVVSLVAWRRSMVEGFDPRRGHVGRDPPLADRRSVSPCSPCSSAGDRRPPTKGVVADQLGRFVGWASVSADPDPAFGATRVILEIEDERFELWVRGRAARLRVDTWRQGDRVWVEGTRRPLEARRASRVAWQHVVGRVRRRRAR